MQLPSDTPGCFTPADPSEQASWVTGNVFQLRKTLPCSSLSSHVLTYFGYGRIFQACAGVWLRLLPDCRCLSSGSPGFPRGCPDAGAFCRHRRVWGDPCHLCQRGLHQPDWELPLRVPHRVHLQQRAADVRRCGLPSLAGPGWEAGPAPLYSLGKSFSL